METKHIVWIIVGSIIFLLIASFISANNTAIGYEQNIEQSLSGIQVQQQRQKSIILQLVQVVEQASKFESETQTEIAKLRTTANGGNVDVDQAQVMISAVAEAYPQLQTNQTYIQLMNEMSVSENLVASYRNTYNSDVKNYKRFVQRFPARMFLAMSGYDVKDYSYLEFSNTELPEQLFK